MKEVLIVLVIVLGQNSLSPGEAQELFRSAQPTFHDVGVDLNLKSSRVRRWPFPRVTQTLENRADILRLWDGYFKRRRNQAVLKYALLPPIGDSGQFWLAGFANDVCAYRRLNPVGLSNAELVNHLGQNRFEHSAVGFIHENLHLLGADHVYGPYHKDGTNSGNVMSPDALRFVDSWKGERPVLSLTKNHVMRCLK